MPLTPQSIEKYNSLKVNKYILNSKKEKPTSIEIKLFDELYIGSFTSLAEFMSRRCFFNEMEPPHYFVDNISAWKLLEGGPVITIVICGEKGKCNAIKLIKVLCQQFNLGINQITLGFEDLTFVKQINSFLEIKELPIQDLIEIPKIKIEPKISFEVYTQGKWQKPIQGYPIEAIKIRITGGGLKYRVYTRNQWLEWTSEDSSGILSYPIKGFQFDYQQPDYNLAYRCHFMNSGYSQWRNASIAKPYNKIIDDFEFRIEQK